MLPQCFPASSVSIVGLKMFLWLSEQSVFCHVQSSIQHQLLQVHTDQKTKGFETVKTAVKDPLLAKLQFFLSVGKQIQPIANHDS